MGSVKIKMNKKTKALVAAGVLVIATAGGAYAYWSTTGNAAGSASTGTSSAFVVTTDAATGGLLTPGGPTQTVAFHVKNTNSGVQRLSAVAVTVATGTGAAWTAVSGCSAADYTVGTPTFTAGDVADGRHRQRDRHDHDEQPRHQPGRLQGRGRSAVRRGQLAREPRTSPWRGDPLRSPRH